MKRFKTKQECKKAGMFTGIWDAHMTRFTINGLWGLPRDVFNEFIDSRFITTDPHPFDSMDIKIRVTPKQSKKLQKKAFAMGYKWNNGQTDIQFTNYVYLYVEHGKIMIGSVEEYFNNAENIELTYKQFMNGTVSKKEFKVGDTVKIIAQNINHGFKIGTIGIIQEKTKDGYYYVRKGNEDWCVDPKDIKHPTKPKPLVFKGHDVIKQKDSYTIGCATIACSDIDAFIRVCEKAQGEATPNEIANFIEKNYK